jgi:hypothetical protein
MTAFHLRTQRRVGKVEVEATFHRILITHSQHSRNYATKPKILQQQAVSIRGQLPHHPPILSHPQVGFESNHQNSSKIPCYIAREHSYTKFILIVDSFSLNYRTNFVGHELGCSCSRSRWGLCRWECLQVHIL